jgi:hypothetical protein
MIVRWMGLAVLAGSLLAQTAAEKLQKGIYAQDTAGDVDGAITIYRDILKAPQTPRPVAATAQFRLSFRRSGISGIGSRVEITNPNRDCVRAVVDERPTTPSRSRLGPYIAVRRRPRAAGRACEGPWRSTAGVAYLARRDSAAILASSDSNCA